MVAYQDFVALSQSRDSEERGQAAHLAAMAYLNHYGPADEHAALYAALIGFLDDPSVRVRGALAYGLLHATEAPRPILLALLHDSPVIARAVVQYSPALIDADLIALIGGADEAMLMATATRERLSRRVTEALIAKGGRPLLVKLLERPDAPFSAAMLRQAADHRGKLALDLHIGRHVGGQDDGIARPDDGALRAVADLGIFGPALVQIEAEFFRRRAPVARIVDPPGIEGRRDDRREQSRAGERHRIGFRPPVAKHVARDGHDRLALYIALAWPLRAFEADPTIWRGHWPLSSGEPERTPCVFGVISGGRRPLTGLA